MSAPDGRAYSDFWLVERYDMNTKKSTKQYISADYAVYDEGKVRSILNEVHPEWFITKIVKVEQGELPPHLQKSN